MKQITKAKNNSYILIILILILVFVVSILIFYSQQISYTGGRSIPTGALSSERDNISGYHNWTIKVLRGSDSFKTDHFHCYLKDEEGNILIRGEPITDLSGEITFNDIDNDGNLSEGDTFYILGEPYGMARVNCSFSLVYIKSPLSYTNDCILE